MSLINKHIVPNKNVMNNLCKIRKILNHYSKLLAVKYKYMYIDQKENDIITITR